jgi:hypothetical protein
LYNRGERERFSLVRTKWAAVDFFCCRTDAVERPRKSNDQRTLSPKEVPLDLALRGDSPKKTSMVCVKPLELTHRLTGRQNLRKKQIPPLFDLYIGTSDKGDCFLC